VWQRTIGLSFNYTDLVLALVTSYSAADAVCLLLPHPMSMNNHLAQFSMLIA
jgi:hypothetical protein